MTIRAHTACGGSSKQYIETASERDELAPTFFFET